MKKKHRHKKHKGQDSERNKEGGEAINQGNRLLDQDKPASSTTGTTCVHLIVKGLALKVFSKGQHLSLVNRQQRLQSSLNF